MKKISITCPVHKKNRLKFIGSGFICTNKKCPHSSAKNRFPVLKKTPVLISDILLDTVCNKDNVKSYIARPTGGLRTVKTLFFNGSKTTRNNINLFIELVKKLSKRPKVLIIGSGQKGDSTQRLWDDEAIELIGTDIYASENVDIICDALPAFPLQSFDEIYSGSFRACH